MSSRRSAGRARTTTGRFSGFSECWFADEAQFLEALATPGWAAASKDSPNVFDESRMWGAALREIVVKDAQPVR